MKLTKLKIISKIVFLFLLFFSTCQFISGCKSADTQTSTAFYTQEPAASLKHDEWKVIKVTGESRIRSADGRPDADCRTVAILDALRKLALQESVGNWDSLAPGDTISCDWNMEGLHLKSSTVVNYGIVVCDIVDLSLLLPEGSEPHPYWSSRNLKLIQPKLGKVKKLNRLTAALEERGINIARSYNFGSDIWREELVVRRKIEG